MIYKYFLYFDWHRLKCIKENFPIAVIENERYACFKHKEVTALSSLTIDKIFETKDGYVLLSEANYSEKELKPIIVDYIISSQQTKLKKHIDEMAKISESIKNVATEHISMIDDTVKANNTENENIQT